MSTPEEIVSRINDLLESPEAYSKDDMVGVAESYKQFCSTVNQRLRQCAEYLRRGLVAEAIYHAEVQPDALDRVNKLVVRDFKHWDSYCLSHGLNRAPRPLQETAKEISEVYGIHNAREELLRRLRLFSLAKAPLKPRLTVLRALRSLDPNVSLWDGDIAAFETARLNEIAKEIGIAAKANNHDTLHVLFDELTDKQWRVRVPTNLLSIAEKELRNAQVHLAKNKLRTMLPFLDQAYMARDYEQCAAVSGQCDEIIATCALTLPENLQLRLEPIRQWVRSVGEDRCREQEFMAACARLQESVEGSSLDHELRRHLQELKKRHAVAVSFGLPLIEGLEQQFERRRNELILELRRKQRRRTMILAGVAIAMLGTLTLVVAVVLQRAKHDATFDAFGRQVGEAVSNPDRIPDARKTWKKLHPQYKDEVSFKKLNDELIRLDESEQKRKKEWKDNGAKLSELVDWLKKTTASVPEYKQNLNEAEQFQKKIAQLNPRGEEKVDLAAWNSEISNAKLKRQKCIDNQFQGKVKPWAEEVHQLEDQSKSMQEADLDRLKKKLDALANQRSELVKSARDNEVSKPTLDSAVDVPSQTLKRLDDVIARRRNEREKGKEEAQAVEALANSATNAKAYKETLNEFCKKYPSNPKVGDFNVAVKLYEKWKGVEAWAELVDTSKEGLWPKTSNTAEARLKSVNNYLKTVPGSPLNQSVNSYQGYLQKAQVALKKDSPLTDTVNTLRLPQFHVYYIEVDQQKYYVNKAVKAIETDYSRGKGARQFQYYISSACKQDETKKKTVPGQDFRDPIPSPQTNLANDLEKLINGSQSVDWSTLGWDAAQKIKDAKGVDAILRLAMIAAVLKDMDSYAWGLEENEIKKAKDGLLKTTANWIDPMDDEANSIRPSAEGKIKNLPRFDEWVKRVKNKREELAGVLDIRCIGRGMVLKTPEGKWRFKTGPTGYAPTGQLLAVVEKSGTQQSELRKIGEVKEGQDKLDESQMAGIPEGSMVFVCDKPRP